MKDLLKRTDLRIVLALVLIIGVAMVLFSGRKESEGEGGTVLRFDEQAYGNELEERLTALIEKIDGVGDVSVMITLEGSVTYSYATDSVYNTQSDGDSKRESTVVLSANGSSKKDAVVSGYSLPRVIGAAVVCSKELSASARARVIGVTSAALGISTSKIYVTN